MSRLFEWVLPATLISDYLKEVATSHDYEGRELLELLQNAADQAQDSSRQGRVIVDLTTDGMADNLRQAALSLAGS
ncbi:MAG: hypothetical protein KAR39_12965 [Thermoplasmata archaeon]|nr:hypothetical protein [Thermoplasmata archaeon]